MKKMTVIGAGVMGHGIAHVASLSGFEVALHDRDAAVLEKALGQIQANMQKGIDRGKLEASARDTAINRIHTTTKLEDAVADSEMVIEAVPEILSLKKEILSKVSEMVSDDTILGTNTSSLSIHEIAAVCKRPERVLGMHFFNPPYAMKLLELVWSESTDKAVLKKTEEIALQMGREVIVVKDSPGFATSRLGVILGLEAMRMLEQGVASAEAIDKAMELGYRHPMGPLKLSDMVGLDVRLGIADYLFEKLGSEQYRAPQILRDLVEQKKLGKKTGHGFYDWSKEK